MIGLFMVLKWAELRGRGVVSRWGSGAGLLSSDWGCENGRETRHECDLCQTRILCCECFSRRRCSVLVQPFGPLTDTALSFQIFSRVGKVLKIVTFTKNSSFQALIQYPDVVTAQAAKLVSAAPGDMRRRRG